MKREIRIPKQKRSIEKKNKIIEAAYKLFNEKGYHNTNTAEIAKEAGFSTGCLYDYFIDKEDLFIDALKMHNNQITQLVRQKLNTLPSDMSLYDIIHNFLLILMDTHNHSAGFHKEVMALSYTNNEINNFIKSYENQSILTNFINYLKNKNINLDNEKEKMLLFLNTADNLCHQLIFENNNYINKDIYISECLHMLEHLLTK